MKNSGRVVKFLVLFPWALFAQSHVIGEALGQMGNNLFQVATASALAWDHGAVAYFPRLAHEPSLYQHVFSRCKLYPPSEEIAFEWHELSHPYHPIPFVPNMKIYGYFQSPKYFAHHRDKLLHLFAPTARDRQYMEKKYKWLIDHPHSVGVQIRYYEDDVDGHIFVQYGEDYLKKAMAQFPENTLFIVSSNNLEFARQNISGENVVFLEDEPHYIDFYLLSLCKDIIITNSTFGWWAAWLNQNPEKKVVCPVTWFNGYDTRDLCPDDWIKVDGKKGRISDPKSYLEGHSFLSEETLNRLAPNSLNRYAYIVYSQNGEDGIIEEIFKRLNIEKGFFVEFGSGDGIALSNTRNLWQKGWSGAMIDSSLELVKSLKENYKDAQNVLCLRYTVVDGISNYGVTLDQIAKKYFPDQEIDFLSIDIDGLDYLILKSLKCRPKVICIECNLYWHPLFSKEVPEAVAAGNLQQPLPVMIELAREMGYEPVAMTINLFLVRRDLYEPFKQTPSDALTLWRDGFRSQPFRECILVHRQSNPYIRRYEDPGLEPLSVEF